MKFIKKYILLVLLIENLLVQSSVFGMSEWPFYILIVIGGLMIFNHELWIRRTYKECKPLYVLTLVYILYQFTIGLGTISSQTLIYLMAKISTFIIIIISVVNNWSFCAEKLPNYITIATLVVLVIGLFVSPDLSSGERMTVGFVNPNETGAHAAICISGLLFMKPIKNKLLYTIALLLAIYSLFASGSRNSLLMLFVILLIWTNFSIKRFSVLLLISLLFLIFILYLDFNLAGITRIIDTLNGEIGNNREFEIEAAWVMIHEKPMMGWGLGAKLQGTALLLYPDALGAHNGYLETIIFMGYPFAILWFICFFVYFFKTLRYAKSDNLYLRYFSSVLISLVLATFNESYFVGVHEFKTNMIFYSLAMLMVFKYRERYNVPM